MLQPIDCRSVHDGVKKPVMSQAILVPPGDSSVRGTSDKVERFGDSPRILEC